MVTVTEELCGEWWYDKYNNQRRGSTSEMTERCRIVSVTNSGMDEQSRKRGIDGNTVKVVQTFL